MSRPQLAQPTQIIQIDHFARDCQEIIQGAQNLADEMKHGTYTPMHLLSVAMKNESVLKTFKALNLSEKELVGKIGSALDKIEPVEGDEGAHMSRETDKMLLALGKDSSTSDLVYIERLFGALMKEYKPNAALFQGLGMEEKTVCAKLGEVRKARFSQMNKSDLLNMETEIGKRVIGQREAISAVSRVVRRSFAGLNEPGKPLSSLLFLGPSGVGKTELAKALAHFLYKDERKLLRLDCSEMREAFQAIRLTGSPNGYHGSEEGGQLTEFVKKEPNAIVLFDEIEKAHPSVFDILLSVADAAILSDGRGRQVDFSSTILILTSNIGSREIIDHSTNVVGDDAEAGKDELREMLLHKVMAFLRPELVNRLDQTIVFDSLSKMEISQIVEIQIRALQKLLKRQEMTIAFDQSAREVISMLGFDPLFGARPMKRVLTKYVRDPLATKIITGDYQEGSHISVSYDGNQFQLN